MNEINLANPHEYDHTHSSSAGSGWLRAAVFGAMDGLVSNVGLIAGIAAAGAAPGIVAITGVSGLIAGAISMALGEYTSVRTQNEQLRVEVETERDALQRNPVGEEAELSTMFESLGMLPETARDAAAQVHANTEQALRVHLAHELGLSPDEQPSPRVAALASLASFSVGAIIPVLPFLLGFGTLWWGLLFGAAVGALLLAVSWVLGRVFTSDPAVLDLVWIAVVALAVAQPVAGFVFVLDGVLIGAGDVRYLAWTGLLNLAVYLPFLLLALPFVDAALPGLAAGSWSVAIIWAAFALGYLGSRAVTLGLRARTDRWLVLGATR